MSTFQGIAAEFPEIRIDYFCTIPDAMPPLACFLSHVHSDHLRGLESLKSPFVYCSLVTKQMLLRLEKYPHRMNFAKGILESRKVTYRHLRKILKPIPLETPTEIELRPGYQIRVTLFDANHCPGAVMFLVEGNGKAILYTGDIRSEPWWVNALIRNPVFIPFTCGIKVLDKLYLDTTYAMGWKSCHTFPSKADGLRELLQRVAHYPSHTVFHFNAWTYGYEDVWLCLSSALNSKIHVDQYKWRIYKSLTETTQSSQQHTERQMPITGYGPALCGYNFGNSFQLGCLTRDENVRLHSCERGTECSCFTADNVVRITPIITRTSNNKVITEPGAGGGDLRQIHDLELGNAGMTDQLMQLCLHHLADQRLVDEISSMLQRAVSRGKSTLSLNGLGLDSEDIDVPLLDVVQLLVRRVSKDSERQQQKADPAHSKEPGLHQPNHSVRSSRKELPRTLTFPYSRHSSYQELCHLVEAFRPKDVYPCVVDQEYAADSETSIETLFGHLCSGTGFAYDEEVLQHPMKKARTSRSEEDLTRSSTQRTSEPETSQTAETASTTMHAPQQHRHDNHRGEATHEQQPSSAAVESASHANGGIVPDTPKPHLPSETHNRPSPRFQLNLGVKSQANRVETIKKSFRRRRPAGRTDDKTRSAQVHSHTTMQDQIQTRSNNAAGSISAQAATSAESARGVGSALVQNSQRRGVTEDPNSVARQADTQYRCIGTASTSTSQYKDEDEDEEMLEALFDSQSTTIGKEELAARLGRRGEAYKAVAVDEWESTSAWSVHSPLTAGNNHTEEEMVL